MENDSDQMEAIVRRVEKVERANRRLTLISFALGAMLVLVFALGATKQAAVPDVLRAKRLEIVDDKGKTRMALEIDAYSGPKFSLLGADGIRRIDLGSLADGSALVLYDTKGNYRATLSVSPDGPWLALEDKDGKVIWQAPPTGSGLPPVAPEKK